MTASIEAAERLQFGPAIEEDTAQALFEVAAGRAPGMEATARLTAYGLAYEMTVVPAGLLLTLEGWKVLGIWRRRGVQKE